MKTNSKKKKQTTKQESNLLYKLLFISIFVQAAAIAACMLIYRPSLPTEAFDAFRSFTQSCGRQAEAAAEWFGSLREKHSKSGASETEYSVLQGSARPDTDSTDEPLTFIPSKELGSVSDLENSDVPEDFSFYYIMLDTAMGPMIYYNQGDQRWADYLYGGMDPLSRYGCGPTSLAMLISSFSKDGDGFTPVEIADWATEHGCFAPQSGSYHALIKKALTAYGFQVKSVTRRTAEHTSELLKSGHILVALMKRGTLTQSAGHFILITEFLDNGNVWIADPNSYENSCKEWELEALLAELKLSASDGGPLWAVSLPE